ncbi:MAG: 4'-phosphopantetheinyl transferase family protein [Thermoanaerobaculia bacterium]
MMQVWICSVGEESDDLLALLSHDERRRADGFRFAADRRRYIVAHGRLRQLLGESLGADPAALVFDAGSNGKPFVTGRPVEFNLSHSGDVALIVIADDPVGADIERIEARPGIGTIAKESFQPDEQAWLNKQADVHRAFFRLWTLKEAAIKADGVGLSLPLDDVSIDTSALDNSSQIEVRVRELRWVAHEISIGPQYCAAVAGQKPAAMHIRRLKPLRPGALPPAADRSPPR